ncbi:hypothetical protein [Conchiformibius steedae]|uniref:ATP-grasp domain-containing protein n=1 Tax=Conchiformibius steedae TaxID=153493 RepID=A0A3P2A739_9NEIS|nr:hypothetical protein [Conchiformibius steedae]RRD91302.1 hypothetical protein EII21_02640 [Conchiformibius steedae]
MNAIEKNEINFPLVIKPRWGSGSIGMEFPESIDELVLAYNLLEIKLKKTILFEASKDDWDNAILIQEKIVGVEYCMDIVNDLETNYYGTFVRKKISSRSGETDLVQKSNAGLTVEADNPIALKLAIERLYYMSDCDRTVLGNNGKKFVLQNLTYEKIASKLVGIFFTNTSN